MNIFAGLENIVKKDVPMADYTWYRLGGPADWLICPTTVEQLAAALKRCADNDMEIFVLGNGSNLLIRDEGVRGAVIKLDGADFGRYAFDGITLTAGAAADIGHIIRDAVKLGLGGLEALTGIPGTVGGAIKMNAGGRFGDIGACTRKITLMSKTGEIFEKEKPELVFDYRKVNITARIILSSELELSAGNPEELVKTVKEVWIYKKNTQPLDTRNAGCIFKNPRGMSAGALIDRAGLKGATVGGAIVSDKHANFIVTKKGCKSSDILGLMDKIRQTILEQFNVELEQEIEIW